MNSLLKEIKSCKVCKDFLEPNPFVRASIHSKIAVIGQAPGRKVHETNIPWNDASGKLLRQWMRISDDDFYNPEKTALIPMGFCYPGKGKTGDLPPRKECAEIFHYRLFEKLEKIELTILIGQYAQKHYLKDSFKENLTETVKHYYEFLDDGIIPLPHPSPRNIFWLKRNAWFKKDVLPALQKLVYSIL